MNNFKEGKCYTREEISADLGGGTRDFFPHKNGHVVCGCFKRELNPDAPAVVLPGNTDAIRRWAEVFATQLEAIPIFIKKRTNEWEYVGLWRCVLKTQDADEIKMRQARAGRNEVSMVLKLVKQ
jgi:hypothetical protein